MYPTSPAPKVCLGIKSSPKTPISSAIYSLSVESSFTLSRRLIVPLITLKYAIIPRKLLKTESKIIAWKGAARSPLGGGTLSITAFNIACTPRPDFPDAGMMSDSSQPMRSMI